MVSLRDYQRDALANLRRSIAQGRRHPILGSPTGSGKTVMAQGLIESARDKGSRVLFLAPRRELVHQASRTLGEGRIPHSIIMAGHQPALSSPVQVASWDTLRAWTRKGKIDAPQADLVIVDECHLSVAPTYLELLEQHYEDAVVVGLTATPARSDGKPLGRFYDNLIEAADVRTLTEWGYLVPTRYYAPSKPDLEKLRVERGDYATKDVEQAFNKPSIVGDVVSNWWRIASDRQTVVFAATVAHAAHLRDRFRETGVSAELVHGSMPNEERDEVLRNVATGRTQVVCNCDVLTFGWDQPSVSCAVLARPTRSIVRYLQTVGRVLRPCEGKQDALVIDHGGVVDDLGFVDEPIPWQLHGEERVQDQKKRQREKQQSSPITCADCGRVYEGQRICPRCGQEPPMPTKAPDALDGELEELDRDKRRRNQKWSWDEKRRFAGELKTFAARKGFKQGWVAHKYREKFGVWPNDPRVKNAPQVEPSQETLAWIKSRQIAAAKRAEKRKEAA